ncbi:hypothetical protein MY3296_001062 [Beauveria thailandica]
MWSLLYILSFYSTVPAVLRLFSTKHQPGYTAGSTSSEITHTARILQSQNGFGFSRREDSPAAASGASYRDCLDGQWWCQI